MSDPNLMTGARVNVSEGCPSCFKTGYKGREAIFEFLSPGRELKKAIAARSPEADMQEILQKEGFKTMRQHGVEKVLAGQTSVDEVLKQTV